ncbi:MAG: tetratricopeptide repeat protein [Deltaproteobacteria bacterium]|nr:tetratricopeptide repeat protein [Deltaproteobacteria bacterium]
MRMMVLVFSMVVAVQATSVAHAADGDAQQAFLNGARLYEKGEYAKAAQWFRMAYEAQPNWKILYNIGQCEAEAKQYARAIDAFEQYLKEGAEAIDAEKKKQVEQELALLHSRQLFKDGTELFARQKYVEAVAAFRGAYAIKPHWKILYNIGQSEAAAGHYGLAVEAFEKYLALGGDNIDEIRLSEMELELDRLQRRVGFISVSAPKGAEIFVDGNARGRAPLPGRLIVVAGVNHELKVVFGGKELENRIVKVSGRQSTSVVVGEKRDNNQSKNAVVTQKTTPNDGAEPLGKIKKTEPRQRITNATWKKMMVPAGVGLMAGGGASLLASLVTGVVIKKRRDDLECKDGVCPPAYHSKNDSLNKMISAGNVLFVTGVSVAAVGAVLFIVGKKRFGKEQTVAVTPAMGPQMGGVVLTGRF